MVHGGNGGPPWVDPTMVAPEPSSKGEKLRPLKRSAVNSRLPNEMVLPREKPPHDRRSLLVAMTSANDGTIGTSRGIACY
jgi:hypothetical protein